MTSTIGVCVINYNTRDHLRACLNSLASESPATVIVVDNASPDKSADMVRREFPQVKLIANTANLGFGAAANQAISACQTPFVLLLNSDTRVHPGAVDALARYLGQSPKAAIVGPRLLNPDGTLQPSARRFPGTLSWLLDNRFCGKLARRLDIHPKSMLQVWKHDQARRVPWVIGAAAALRIRALRDVGGFDPGFFLYCEEIDLCMRLWASGWEVHFTPAACVVHVGGASTPGDRRAADNHMVASTLRLYRLHYGRIRAGLLRIMLRAKLTIARWTARQNRAVTIAEAGVAPSPSGCARRT